jgi:hypothetical protein
MIVKTTSRLLLISVLLPVLFSCESRPVQEVLFYPVDSLLDNQVRQLVASHATLKKSAMMGNDASVAEYEPVDTVAWKKELEIFYHISAINKPVNKSSYSVREEKMPGLICKSFTSKDDVPVQFLKVYYQESPEVPAKLEARVHESNSMFEGTRDLRMTFDRVGNNITLSEYVIEGGQQMFMADSVQYKITGSISISR